MEMATERLDSSAHHENDEINLRVTRSRRFSVVEPPGNTRSPSTLMH